MMSDFDIQLQKLIVSAENPNEHWDHMSQILDRLKAQHRNDEERKHALHNAELEIRERRGQLFRQELLHLREEIQRGQLYDFSEFNRRRAALRDLGKHDARLNREIASLQDDWDAQVDVVTLKEDASRGIKAYQEDIDDGKDFEAARDRHLKPLSEAIERIRQERGTTPVVDALWAEIRQMIKNADKTGVSTLATTGQFEKILKNLALIRDPNYRELLRDSDGTVHGTLPLQDAIYWYQERADAYAERKADEYLAEARKSLLAGRIYEADIRIQEGKGLFRISDKKVNELIQFHAEKIAPLLNRIEFAREKLQGIPLTSNLDTAIGDYKDAIESERGWRLFETTDSASGEGTQIVQRARDFIIQSLEQQLEVRLRTLEDSTQIQFITNALSREDLSKLNTYITWGGISSPLFSKFGSRFALLEAQYNAQQELHERVNAAARAAQAGIDAQDYARAYETLRAYENVITTQGVLFPQVVTLWNRVNALFNMRYVKLTITNALDAGFNALELDAETVRFEGLLQQAVDAVDANTHEAHTLGLNHDIANIKQLLALLQGLKLRNAQQFDLAIKAWRENIPAGSRFEGQAREFIAEVDSRMKADAVLDEAILRARRALGNGRPDEAYRLLLPNDGKTDVKSYAEFRSLLEEVRSIYGLHLVELIVNNIDSNPDTPQELQRLVSTLEEVDNGLRQMHAAEIDLALLQQKAAYRERLAIAAKTSERWYDALAAWRELNDVVSQSHMPQIYERYAEAYVDEALRESIAQSGDIETARKPLDTMAFEGIQILTTHVRNSPLIPILRARVYAQLLRLSDSPVLMRRNAQSLRVSLSQFTDDQLIQPESLQLAATLDDADDLAALAESIDASYIANAPLRDWVDAQEEWRKTISRMQAFIGIVAWYERRVEEALQILGTPSWTIGEDVVLPLETLARRSVIGDRIRDLRPYLEQLKKDVQMAFTDTTTASASEYKRFERGAWALAFLANPDVQFDAPIDAPIDAPDFDIDANDIYDLERFAVYMAHALKVKAEEITMFERLLMKARGLLDSATITGDFPVIDDTLKPIIHGNLAAYSKQHTYQEFHKEFSEAKTQHDRLDKITQDIKQCFEAEDYAKLHQLLDELDDQPSGDDGVRPSQRIRINDAFASDEPLVGTERVRDRVGKKQVQIQVTESWLKPLVNLDDLYQRLRDDTGNLVQSLKFDLADAKIVDFESVAPQIQTLRNQALYQQAGELLAQVEIGSGGTENKPTHFNRDLFSVFEAFSHIRAIPVSRKSLNSKTSRLMFEWGAELFRALKPILEKINECYDDLDVARKEFDIQYKNFLDAVEGARSTQGREKAKFFEQLETIYTLLHGANIAKLEFNPETAKYHYHLYPLAPQHAGIKKLYDETQRYR